MPTNKISVKKLETETKKVIANFNNAWLYKSPHKIKLVYPQYAIG